MRVLGRKMLARKMHGSKKKARGCSLLPQLPRYYRCRHGDLSYLAMSKSLCFWIHLEDFAFFCYYSSHLGYEFCLEGT